MQTELIKQLNQILKEFPEYWEGETLQRSVVINDIKNKKPILIKALISNPKIKELYGSEIEGVLIFDFESLISLLRYKEYWANSFTKYRNSVGLTSEGKYLNYNSDVVLDFPFKDCVLEGGMTKEEQGKNEVYYNEIIARDEIDRLFSPKALTNVKRYSKDGVEDNITDFKDSDNLIIKGNNLIALHSLKERYAGKVKLIYIDPPYNTGNDSFKYNDRFNHSTWLTFMKSRLEVASELLRDDGVIFIQCDDNESAYLKVLMDNIYGIDNFINTIIVKSSTPSGTKTAHREKTIIKLKDCILVYKKNNVKFNPQFIVKDKWDSHYSLFLEKIDNQWVLKNLIDILIENKIIDRKISLKDLDINNKDFKKFYLENCENICRLQSHKNIDAKQASNNIGNRVYEHFNEKGDLLGLYYNGQVITPLKQGIQKVIINRRFTNDLGMLLCDFWDDIDFQNTQNEGGVSFPTAKKPEMLISRIIEMTTNKDDIVLDFFLGSGTTASVCMKSSRKFIGIEQMDYGTDDSVKRLTNVIGGEQSGTSTLYAWRGGGSFVYAELMEFNYRYIHDIQKAQNYDELVKLFERMKETAHLNYLVELDKILATEYETDGISQMVGFNELALEEQKQLLIELLDKNQLYVNVSEMNDSDLNVSEPDKAFTKSFYGND
ncbi:adenine-specific DNA-methyltransferase [Orbus hercynius]|uniref:site-specific DNA-methyltransferase (adenine-specific) n=1 Tax=Orbus hercynius TaxID=593135 RepID=A0A495RI33_9GAMM|nr:site-specific DNA-methyltransferase [Orbus hercynius]RKS87081.1 adenine-specific DNA-methyltransferase [Orbus hercynius]